MPSTLDILAKERIKNNHAFFMITDYVQNGKEKTIADIETFLERRGFGKSCNDFLPDNFKNGFTSDELRSQVLQYIPISSAIDEWLATIENEKTGSRYADAFRHLRHDPENNVLARILKDNTNITSLDRDWGGTEGVYNVIRDLGMTQSTAKVAISAYATFCDFLRVKTLGIIDPEVVPKRKKDFYKTELIYDQVDWGKFISALPTPFDLVGELIYLSSKQCHFMLRVSDPRRNVLSLNTSQVFFDLEGVSFEAEQSYHCIGARIRFPAEFMIKLMNYVGDRTGLVFVHPETQCSCMGNRPREPLKRLPRCSDMKKYPLSCCHGLER